MKRIKLNKIIKSNGKNILKKDGKIIRVKKTPKRIKNKFKLDFNEIRHGWTSIFISNNKILSIVMHGSGVFNPMWNLPEILERVSKKKNAVWIVDQEGFDGKVRIKQLGCGLIAVETEELRHKDRRKFVKKEVIYSKKQFLKEFKSKLIKFEKENKKEISVDFYDFSFDIQRIKNLKV